MQYIRSPGESESNAPEVWAVDDPADFQFLVSHDPPRPGCFLRLLKADLRSRLARKHWAAGGWCVLLGLLIFLIGGQQGWMWLAFSGLAPALLGVFLLSLRLRQFLAVVRMYRRGPLLRGEIRSLRPHAFARDHSTAEARLADGRSLLVSVPTDPAAALLGRDGRAEVLLIAAPDQRQGYVIGIQAVPRDRGEDAVGPVDSGIQPGRSQATQHDGEYAT
jgi:hypothetical protein